MNTNRKKFNKALVNSESTYDDQIWNESVIHFKNSIKPNSPSKDLFGLRTHDAGEFNKFKSNLINKLNKLILTKNELICLNLLFIQKITKSKILSGNACQISSDQPTNSSIAGVGELSPVSTVRESRSKSRARAQNKPQVQSSRGRENRPQSQTPARSKSNPRTKTNVKANKSYADQLRGARTNKPVLFRAAEQPKVEKPQIQAKCRKCTGCNDCEKASLVSKYLGMNYYGRLQAFENKNTDQREKEIIARDHTKFYERNVNGILAETSGKLAKIQIIGGKLVPCHISNVPTSFPNSKNLFTMNMKKLQVTFDIVNERFGPDAGKPTAINVRLPNGNQIDTLDYWKSKEQLTQEAMYSPPATDSQISQDPWESPFTRPEEDSSLGASQFETSIDLDKSDEESNVSERYRYLLPGDIDSDIISEVEDDDIMGHIYTPIDAEVITSQETVDTQEVITSLDNSFLPETAESQMGINSNPTPIPPKAAIVLSAKKTRTGKERI